MLTPHLRLGTLLPLCVIASLTSCEKAKQAPPAAPPPLVITSTVNKQDVPVIVENVAQTEAAATVEIRARVQGFLTEAPFKEGSLVKKGDLLFQIDPKPFQAAVDQAKANLQKAEATAERAQADVDRLTPLVQQKAISQQDLDTATATSKVSAADVLAAKAALTTAELNLGYTQMRAPFDGLIGARLVDVGNFVGSTADTLLLATISTTDPMRVSFNVSENNYIRFQKRFMGNESARKEHSETIAFELILSDGSVYEHKGKFEFADRALDAKAGTLKIVLSFPNNELLLRPGQFGRVRSKTDTLPGAILVPQRSVVTTQSVQSVLLVGSDNKVTQQTINTSERYGEFFVVTSGLTGGERVIVEGLQKVRPGMIVSPKEQVADKSASKDVAPKATAPGQTPAAAAPSDKAPSAPVTQ